MRFLWEGQFRGFWDNAFLKMHGLYSLNDNLGLKISLQHSNGPKHLMLTQKDQIQNNFFSTKLSCIQCTVGGILGVLHNIVNSKIVAVLNLQKETGASLECGKCVFHELIANWSKIFWQIIEHNHPIQDILTDHWTQAYPASKAVTKYLRSPWWFVLWKPAAGKLSTQHRSSLIHIFLEILPLHF